MNISFADGHAESMIWSETFQPLGQPVSYTDLLGNTVTDAPTM